MADPLSITAGAIAVITAAVQSTTALISLAQQYKTSAKYLQDLQREFEDLQGVLETLSELSKQDEDLVSTIRHPLRECERICKDFGMLVQRCCPGLAEGNMSVQIFTRIQRRKSDIMEHQKMLATYKQTISIAMAGVNLRYARVTADAVKQYNTLIVKTQDELHARLDVLETKLDIHADSANHSSADLDIDAKSLSEIHEELESTQYCLEICHDVAGHITKRRSVMDHSQCRSPRSNRRTASSDSSSAEQLTTSMLRTFEGDLQEMMSRFRLRAEGLEKRSQLLLSEPGTSANVGPEEMRDLAEGFRECLNVCEAGQEQATQARKNLFENVAAGHHSQQILVSTIGELIHARGVTVEHNSIQFMGQASDESIQVVSKNASNTTPTKSERDVGEPSLNRDFSSRYGAGATLATPLRHSASTS